MAQIEQNPHLSEVRPPASWSDKILETLRSTPAGRAYLAASHGFVNALKGMITHPGSRVHFPGETPEQIQIVDNAMRQMQVATGVLDLPMSGGGANAVMEGVGKVGDFLNTPVSAPHMLSSGGSGAIGSTATTRPQVAVAPTKTVQARPTAITRPQAQQVIKQQQPQAEHTVTQASGGGKSGSQQIIRPHGTHPVTVKHTTTKQVPIARPKVNLMNGVPMITGGETTLMQKVMGANYNPNKWNPLTPQGQTKAPSTGDMITSFLGKTFGGLQLQFGGGGGHDNKLTDAQKSAIEYQRQVDAQKQAEAGLQRIRSGLDVGEAFRNHQKIVDVGGVPYLATDTAGIAKRRQAMAKAEQAGQTAQSGLSSTIGKINQALGTLPTTTTTTTTTTETKQVANKLTPEQIKHNQELEKLRAYWRSPEAMKYAQAQAIANQKTVTPTVTRPLSDKELQAIRDIKATDTMAREQQRADANQQKGTVSRDVTYWDNYMKDRQAEALEHQGIGTVSRDVAYWDSYMKDRQAEALRRQSVGTVSRDDAYWNDYMKQRQAEALGSQGVGTVSRDIGYWDTYMRDRQAEAKANQQTGTVSRDIAYWDAYMRERQAEALSRQGVGTVTPPTPIVPVSVVTGESGNSGDKGSGSGDKDKDKEKEGYNIYHEDRKDETGASSVATITDIIQPQQPKGHQIFKQHHTLTETSKENETSNRLGVGKETAHVNLFWNRALQGNSKMKLALNMRKGVI